MRFWLIIFALWTYPVVSFLLFKLTKRKLELRKNILKVIALLTGVALVGLLTKISTTSSTIDWVVITVPFLMGCSVLWWTLFQSNKTIRVLGAIAILLVFGFGYLSSTVGIVGVGFVISEYETDREIWFENGLIYKELNLGNALSDFRGARIEINRTIKWFPVIEWQVTSKEYSSSMVYGKPLNARYDAIKEEFYLDVEKQWRDSMYYWNDTIRLEK